MRLERNIPKTDLNKLSKEILSRGPIAALPRNLPDRWLRTLGRDIAYIHKMALYGRGDGDAKGPVLVALALLAHKNSIDMADHNFSEEQVAEAVQKYSAAVLDEIVGRQTGIYLFDHNLNSIV